LNNIWTDTRARTSLARGIALALALAALFALLAARPHDRSSWLAVAAVAGILAFLAPRAAARAPRLREQGPMRAPELSIADLLGREEVRIDTAACAEYLHDQVVLVTGAAGSIGSELCRQLLALRPRQLIVLDTNETGLFDLDADLQAIRGATDVAVCIADIADEGRVAMVFRHYRPHVVFHAAAYKHVPLLEKHAGETVKTNVLGTTLLCRHAHASGARRFVFISSDKAVAPTSNLGYSKRIGELLVRGYARESETLFCAVRQRHREQGQRHPHVRAADRVGGAAHGDPPRGDALLHERARGRRARDPGRSRRRERLHPHAGYGAPRVDRPSR